MFMEYLSLTYKCHSSIGNSLDLHLMIKEVLVTFVEETNALNGIFYLINEENKFYKYQKYNDFIEYESQLLENNVKDFKFVKVFDIDEKKILTIPLNKGVFVIIYEKLELNFEYLISMFQDLIVKLNISIDACLNVQKMKDKNKILKHLTNELKEKQNKLLEADKYKTNFLANMSHELKTPLNSIIVISSIMAKNKNGKLDDEQIKNMRIINNCGNDLLILINDILDISKIEAGEIKISLSKTNINSLVENLIEEMQPLALEKNLTLYSTCLLNQISLLTDTNRIKQILKNLLSNAVKFTEKGNIEIILEENANDITVKVIDQGIGIAQEKLEHIFERFKQADGSTTRKYGGTGLGLAISKELALLLGGDIKAFSKLGEGSTFELILPKKTNIKNISDDKVIISSKSDELEVVVDEIILFDMNIKEESEIEKKIYKVVVVNGEYGSFFTIAVRLKKEGINIIYSETVLDTYSILNEKVDLVVLYLEELDSPALDFLNYCFEHKTKYIIVSSKIQNEHSLSISEVKEVLFNKINSYLGR